MLAQLGPELVARLDALHEDDERAQRLTLELVRLADNGRLRDLWMAHEGGLNLGVADPVSRDIEDVVCSSLDPEVAVLVHPGDVTGQVRVLEPAPVDVLVAVRVLVETSKHARPRLLYDEMAARARDGLAFLIVDLGGDARERLRGRARLQWRDGQRCDHEVARLSLPPRVHDRAVLLADELVIPHPRLGVDRLADRTQEPQGAHRVLIGMSFAQLHMRPDRGRGGVEDRDLVALDHLPPSVGIRERRGALVEHRGRTEDHRTVDDVAVSRDPTDVGRAPPDVVFFEVEDPLQGRCRADGVAGVGVLDALRVTGRAGRVEDVEEVVRVQLLSLALGGLVGRDLVPPVVATLGPRHLVAGPLVDDAVLDRRRLLHRVIGLRLQSDLLAAAPEVVARDDELRLAVVEPLGERRRAETREDDRVDGADLGAREHGDRKLDEHRHVEADPVALADAQASHSVGELVDLAIYLRVGPLLDLAGLTLEPEADLVLHVCLHVPVESVVDDVVLATDEPLGPRGLPLEDLVVGLVEVQELIGHFLPEPLDVLAFLEEFVEGLDAMLVHPGLDVAVRNQLRRGLEHTVLRQQYLNVLFLFHHLLFRHVLLLIEGTASVTRTCT